MARQTSITDAAMNALAREGKPQDRVTCTQITGFLLMKVSDAKTLKSGKTKPATLAWRLRYSDAAGNRRVATIADGTVKPVQAAEIALEWRQELKRGNDPLTIKQRATDAMKAQEKAAESDKYLNTGTYFEKIYTPYQLKNRRNGKYTLHAIKLNFAHLFSRSMDALTAADVEDWYEQRRAAGLARSSLTRDYGAFKAMLNHATKPKRDNPPVLRHNPLDKVSLPEMAPAENIEEEQRKAARARKRDLLNDEDKAAINKGLALFADKIRAQRRSSIKHGKKGLRDLDSVPYPHWFLAFTELARLTGMRPGDIRELKWENIHHNRFNGQTDLIFTPSKTRDKSYVEVKFPVSGKLARVLDDWREQNDNPTTGHLFKSNRTGGPMEKKSYRAHWLTVRELGGVREDLDFYGFRHNFISDLVARQVPVMDIAGLVGHKGPDMIINNYLRRNEQNSAAVLAAFGDSWDTEPEQEGDNKERTA